MEKMAWHAGMPNFVKLETPIRLLAIRPQYYFHPKLGYGLEIGQEYTAIASSFWCGEPRYLIAEVEYECPASYFRNVS
jgi:hypothetical protein